MARSAIATFMPKGHDYLATLAPKVTLYKKICILPAEDGQWITPETTGEVPCPREGHAAVSVDQAVYVFGGYKRAGKEGENDLYFDDMYRLDTGDMKAPALLFLTGFYMQRYWFVNESALCHLLTR